MGKKLIIKGADFSENGIGIEKNLNEFIPCLVQYGWSIGNGFTIIENVKRAICNITMTSVFTGMAGVKLTPKSGYKLAAIVWNNITEGGMNYLFTDAWVASYSTDEHVLNFNSGNSLVMMVAPVDDTSISQLTSNDWDTYLDVEYLY